MEGAVNKLKVASAVDAPIKITPAVLKNKNISWEETDVLLLSLELAQARDVPRICGLLDLLLAGAGAEHCSRNMVFFALEEIVQALPVATVEQLWPYMETRRDALTQGLEGVRAPGTTLLRTLNSLLRRLSPIENATFIAHIYQYLADALGPAEKTGLNSTGNYFPYTYCNYDRSYQNEDYQLFWKLQDDFRYPPALLEDQSLSEFLTKLEEIPRLFSGPAEEEQSRSLVWNTLPAMFEAQLADQGVRRVVSMQVLFLIEFLLGQSSTERQKLLGKSVNRGVLYDYTLDDVSLSRINSLKSIWFKLLRDTLSRPQMSSLREIILNEKQWSQWKLENCQKFSRPVSEDVPSLAEGYKERLQKLALPRKKFWNKMGSKQLSQLWETETGLAALEAKHVPGTTQELLGDVEKRFEAETTPDAKSAYGWLALRLLQNNMSWSELKSKGSASPFGALFDVPVFEREIEGDEEQAETPDRHNTTRDDAGDDGPSPKRVKLEDEKGEGEDEKAGGEDDVATAKSE